MFLFVPTDGSCNLSNPSQVDSLQDQSQRALDDYVHYQYPQHSSRFGSLLLRLPALRTVSPTVVQQVFFNSSFTTNKSSIDLLIRDMLVNRPAAVSASNNSSSTTVGWHNYMNRYWICKLNGLPSFLQHSRFFKKVILWLVFIIYFCTYCTYCTYCTSTFWWNKR